MQSSETDVVKGGKPWTRFSPTVWMLLTIGIGLVLGIVIDSLIPRTMSRRPLFVETDYIDIPVSTVELSFLVALLYIYNRTYSETRARFAVGVIVVLIALLFQAILTSSVFYFVMGGSHLSGPFTLAADVAETAAFGVFLYLGLE